MIHRNVRLSGMLHEPTRIYAGMWGSETDGVGDFRGYVDQYPG